MDQTTKVSSLFVAFEGIDGSGKSTQAKMLAVRMGEKGFSVLLTSEPSDGPVGSIIRALRQRLIPEEETRLFTEDRRDHVKRIIRPALEAGRIVLCDRYIYSSAAYQGARGMNPETIITENMVFAPHADITFLLELPVDVAIERISRGRSKTFSAFEDRKTLRAVDAIYQRLQDPSIQRISAARPVQQIHEELTNIVETALGLRNSIGE